MNREQLEEQLAADLGDDIEYLDRVDFDYAWELLPKHGYSAVLGFADKWVANYKHEQACDSQASAAFERQAYGDPDYL